MKKTVNLIVKYFIMYLSCLFPRSRKICIFGAWLGKQYADNSKYLFLCAQKHSTMRPVWITKDASICKEIRRQGYEAYMFHSLKGIFLQLRAKYAIVSNGISDVNHTFMGGAIYLNLWHGVPLKKVGYDDDKTVNWESRGQKIRRAIHKIPLGKEYVVATSQPYAKIYESAFKCPSSRVITLGQVRNDIFFDEEGYFLPKHQLRKAAKGRKIILYTPTHRQEGKEKFPLEENFDFERLNQWCKEKHAVFVIRLHFYHKKETLDLSMYSNIFNITEKEMDIQELLMDTDLLITDYSSTYIDYLLLNRPLMFYEFDYEDYLMNDREMYYPYEEVTPGYHARNFDQFMEELERISQGEDQFKEERKKVCDLFYCKEGQKAIGETLLKIMKRL